MIALLDVNVLIGLVDTTHIHHAPAKRFFQTAQVHGWATCPLTENGTLRILGRPDVGHGPDSPASARILLRSLLARPGHHFWPDDVSLRTPAFSQRFQLPGTSPTFTSLASR